MERGKSFPVNEQFISRGEGKMEKGLRDFHVYRVASAENLTNIGRVRQDQKYGNFKDILDRTLFFTTQKNMAMEYADRDKSVMLEETGEDFLHDLQQCGKGVRVVLLNHEDVGAYQRLRGGGASQEHKDELARFIQNHTYDVEDISLRGLRKAAEIIVLLPDGETMLPLRNRAVTIHPIQSISQMKKRSHAKPAGLFHKQIILHDGKKSRAIHKREAEIATKMAQKATRTHVTEDGRTLFVHEKRVPIVLKMTWNEFQQYSHTSAGRDVLENTENPPVFIELTDTFKGYPLDSRCKVFTGALSVIGSSRMRGDTAIARDYYAGKGIYMNPGDKPYVYVHEFIHFERGDGDRDLQDDEENILAECEIDKKAVEVYCKWAGKNPTELLALLRYKREQVLKLRDAGTISREVFKEVDIVYEHLMRRSRFEIDSRNA